MDGGVIDEPSDTILDAVVDILPIINDNKRGEKGYSFRIKRLSSMVNRCLKILKDIGLIEYAGVVKTGKCSVKENTYLS